MENKTLLQRLLDEGYPKEEVFHHFSDLYVFKTPLTERVIKEWAADNGYHLYRNPFFSVFRDQITGKPMYDVAFQYYESAMA